MGGFLFRLGIGALPFLLPLLLQIGFHLTPFESGLITFTGALGSMFMKAAVARVLRRFGYRPVLVYNSIISGAFLAACERTCVAGGRAADDCANSCQCVADAIERSGEAERLGADALDAAREAEIKRMAEACMTR